MALSFALSAQHTLTPGVKSFDKKWIKPKEYEMAWLGYRDTIGFEMGRVHTSVIINNGVLSIVTKVKMKNFKEPWIDSTVANLETLSPIRHSSYNMQRDMVLNFGKIVTGYYFDKLKNTNLIINDTTGSKYFDSNIYPALLGWLPLKENYTTSIAIYDFNPSAKKGVMAANVKQVTSGTYQSEKNGIRDVWIVNVQDEIGNGGNGTSTYFFDKENRMLWKQEINVNGRKMMMKLIE